MAGFLNIFLYNEQFMDRVHILNKKKSVTHKEGIFSPHNYAENSVQSAFVVRKITIIFR